MIVLSLSFEEYSISMGIKCLLRNLKETEHRVHASKLKGKRVAVDSYCWLHKAITTCAIELVHKQPTRKYIDYMISRVNLLLDAGCTPIMIFDGRDIPMKEETNKQRAQTRDLNLQKGLRLYHCGDTEGAIPLLTQSILVTSELAFSVIQEIRSMGVTCIVSPYEADAQLAFLAREKLVDVVITEDSDLLVYGTPVVWYKFDRSGYAIEQRYEEARKHLASAVGFKDFEYIQFISMCILSGCDYLPSLNGIGVRKASRLVSKFCNIKDIIGALASDPKNAYSQESLDEYAINFEKAMHCFLHHIVYDPSRQTTVHFSALGKKSEKEELIGKLFDDRVSKSMCEDIQIDPHTLDVYKALATSRKRITDFFQSGPKKIPEKSVMSSLSRKRSLNEIILSQSDQNMQESRKVEKKSESGIKVVSRFFKLKRQESEIGKQRVSSQVSQAELREYVIITDDCVPRENKEPNSASPSDTQKTTFSSEDAENLDSSRFRSAECVDIAVRKIARCMDAQYTGHAMTHEQLEAKPIEQIEQILNQNT